MKLLYLAWSAVVADFWVFLTPQPWATSQGAFVATVGMHALACAVLATATHWLLPARYRQPKVLVWLLMFEFAFIAPFVGPLGILIVCHGTLHRETQRLPRANPRTLALLEYNVQNGTAPRSSQGAIRSRLTANVPAPVRLQSLLTLQAVPKRVANPLLEDLLGDDNDDVRLVAFGMLDSEEKKISQHIQRERAHLEKSLAPTQRAACLRHLAELHWELAYSALVQGEMRKYVLGEARRHVEEALAISEERDAGIAFLRARILLAQGETERAEFQFYLAMALGLAEISARPYLAEIAFRRRDMATLRAQMGLLAGRALAPRVQVSVDLWTGRDRFSAHHDRRVLAHI